MLSLQAGVTTPVLPSPGNEPGVSARNPTLLTAAYAEMKAESRVARKSLGVKLARTELAISMKKKRLAACGPSTSVSQRVSSKIIMHTQRDKEPGRCLFGFIRVLVSSADMIIKKEQRTCPSIFNYNRNSSHFRVVECCDSIIRFLN